MQFVKQLTPNMTYLDAYISELKKGPAVLLFVSFRPWLREHALSIIQQVCIVRCGCIYSILLCSYALLTMPTLPGINNFKNFFIAGVRVK